MASPPKSETINSNLKNQDELSRHRHNVNRGRLRCRLITTVTLQLFVFLVYVFWPSNPAVKIIGLKLDHVQIHTFHHISIDISMALSAKIRNVNFYPMTFNAVHMAVGYRGNELAHVTVDGSHVSPRKSSYVDAAVEFDGVHVLHNVVHLLEDLAKGVVPFDTVTKVKAYVKFFSFQIPLKAKVSCEVHINTDNQTIVHQNCYPE